MASAWQSFGVDRGGWTESDAVDPFTSLPRVLPPVDTRGVVRYYPRPVGGWALFGYFAALLLALSLGVPFHHLLPVSLEVFVVLLILSSVVVGALALRAIPGGAVLGTLSAIFLYGVAALLVVAGAAWVADDGMPDGARGLRAAIVGGGALVTIALAVLIEIRRAKVRRVEAALRRIRDAAAAAQRWNSLLRELHRWPGGRDSRCDGPPARRAMPPPGLARRRPVRDGAHRRDRRRSRGLVRDAPGLRDRGPSHRAARHRREPPPHLSTPTPRSRGTWIRSST